MDLGFEGMWLCRDFAQDVEADGVEEGNAEYFLVFDDVKAACGTTTGVANPGCMIEFTPHGNAMGFFAHDFVLFFHPSL